MDGRPEKTGLFPALQYITRWNTPLFFAAYSGKMTWSFWLFGWIQEFFQKTYNKLEYGRKVEKVDKSVKSAIVKESSSYFGCFCRGNKFHYGLKGNPVQVRDDPVTVIASKPHKATGVQRPREGAAGVEHKSGDLLIPCILRFLRKIGKLMGLLCLYFDTGPVPGILPQPFYRP